MLLDSTNRAEHEGIFHVFIWHEGIIKMSPSIVKLFSFSNQMIGCGSNRKQIPIGLQVLTKSETILFILLSTSPQTVIRVVLEVHLFLNAFEAVFMVIFYGRSVLTTNLTRVFSLTYWILIEGLLGVSTLSHRLFFKLGSSVEICSDNSLTTRSSLFKLLLLTTALVILIGLRIMHRILLHIVDNTCSSCQISTQGGQNLVFNASYWLIFQEYLLCLGLLLHEVKSARFIVMVGQQMILS